VKKTPAETVLYRFKGTHAETAVPWEVVIRVAEGRRARVNALLQLRQHLIDCGEDSLKYTPTKCEKIGRRPVIIYSPFVPKPKDTTDDE